MYTLRCIKNVDSSKLNQIAIKMITRRRPRKKKGITLIWQCCMRSIGLCLMAAFVLLTAVVLYTMIYEIAPAYYYHYNSWAIGGVTLFLFVVNIIIIVIRVSYYSSFFSDFQSFLTLQWRFSLIQEVPKASRYLQAYLISIFIWKSLGIWKSIKWLRLQALWVKRPHKMLLWMMMIMITIIGMWIQKKWE